MNNENKAKPKHGKIIVIVVVVLLLVGGVAGCLIYSKYEKGIVADDKQDWSEVCDRINSGAGFNPGQRSQNFDYSQRPDFNPSQRPDFGQGGFDRQGMGSMEDMRNFRSQIEAVCADGIVNDQEEAQLESLFENMPVAMRDRFTAN